MSSAIDDADRECDAHPLLSVFDARRFGIYKISSDSYRIASKLPVVCKFVDELDRTLWGFDGSKIIEGWKWYSAEIV